MKDLTGARFGKLIALSPTEQRDKSNHVCWLCKCDCGEDRIVSSHNLINGFVKSCRKCALINITIRNRNIKRSPKQPDKWRNNERLYSIWRNMKARCYNVRAVNFKYYGGKGIIMCREWKDDYLAFKKWALENGYEDSLTIDRVDSDGNYSPENCRWVSPREQTYNMGNNIIIDFHGKQVSLARFIHDFGLNRQQVYDYLMNVTDL